MSKRISKKTPKKITLKTSKNSLSVSAYLNSIEDANARRDGKSLLRLFKEITASKAVMWGSSIIGFGEYTYYRANGDEGKMMATGFAIRKTGPVLYILPGYQNYQALMSELGKYKLGKSCLYIKKLDDIDIEVLSELIRRGLSDLADKHPVKL